MMGVFYSASIAWGLLVPGHGHEFEEKFEIPEGFSFSVGGDMMGGGGKAVVVHPTGASRRILDSFEGFGVFAIESIHAPTGHEQRELVYFADRYGLNPAIGWFAISSVG